MSLRADDPALEDLERRVKERDEAEARERAEAEAAAATEESGAASAEVPAQRSPEEEKTVTPAPAGSASTRRTSSMAVSDFDAEAFFSEEPPVSRINAVTQLAEALLGVKDDTAEYERRWAKIQSDKPELVAAVRELINLNGTAPAPTPSGTPAATTADSPAPADAGSQVDPNLVFKDGKFVAQKSGEDMIQITRLADTGIVSIPQVKWDEEWERCGRANPQKFFKGMGAKDSKAQKDRNLLIAIGVGVAVGLGLLILLNLAQDFGFSLKHFEDPHALQALNKFLRFVKTILILAAGGYAGWFWFKRNK